MALTPALEARSLPDILTLPLVTSGSHRRRLLSNSSHGHPLGVCEHVDSGTRKMAPQINVPAVQPDGLGSNPGVPMVEKKN